MASVLGSAVLNLTTDATKLTRGLQQAERQTDQSLTKMQRLGDTAAKAAPYAAIGAAAIGAGVGLKALVDDVASVERELRPFLQRSNLTVESLQQWQEIGRQLGAEDPLEGITDSIQEFKLRLGELQTEGTGPLQTALPALGLALQDLQGKTPEEQFRTLLTALQDVDDETRRLYLADELFGGAMENIIGILQAQAKEFQAVEAAVRSTHNVLSGAELQKLKDYNLAVDEIGNTWDGLKQNFVTAIAPALAASLDHINQKTEDFTTELANTKDALVDTNDAFWQFSDDVDKSLASGIRSVGEWGAAVTEGFSPEVAAQVSATAEGIASGIKVNIEPIPGIIGDVMTDEEADIAGYFSDQKEDISVSLAEVAEVAKTGAEGIASDFALKLGAMGSATHDALFGGGAEGEGNLMPSGSVMAAFTKLGPEVAKVIEQGFGEYITPSWRNALTEIGSATWDAFYGGAEGEGAILPTFQTAVSTDIPGYIADAVPVITDETDYLMQDGIQTPVEDGLEEAATLVQDGMDMFQEKVAQAVEPMAGAVTSYGEVSITQPITAAVLEAGRAVQAELASIEAAARATAAAVAASIAHGSLPGGVGGSGSMYDATWERYVTPDGEVRYRNTDPNARVRDISQATYDNIQRRNAAGRQREAIVRGGLYGEAYGGESMPTLPGLPSMDSGGIVSGPTLAALAMNSRPEAVIPLDRLGGMGTTIVFEGPVYGMDDFKDKVEEAVLLGNRQGRQEVFYGAR